jgi:hypothetical protein
MAFGRPRPVRRNRRGEIELHLPDAARQVMAQLCGELRELLGTDDPSLRRLFPTAYHDEPERDVEYQLLARDELLARRVAALDAMAATAGERQLDTAGLTAWMGSVNDLRLVIGTNLDVSEEDGPFDPDAPDASARAVYGYLTALLDEVVRALHDGLGDDVPSA